MPSQVGDLEDADLFALPGGGLKPGLELFLSLSLGAIRSRDVMESGARVIDGVAVRCERRGENRLEERGGDGATLVASLVRT